MAEHIGLDGLPIKDPTIFPRTVEAFTVLLKQLDPKVFGSDVDPKEITEARFAVIHKDEEKGAKYLGATDAEMLSGDYYDLVRMRGRLEYEDAMGAMLLQSGEELRMYPDPQGSERIQLHIPFLEEVFKDDVVSVDFGGVYCQSRLIGLPEVGDNVMDIVIYSNVRSWDSKTTLAQIGTLTERLEASDDGIISIA